MVAVLRFWLKDMRLKVADLARLALQVRDLGAPAVLTGSLQLPRGGLLASVQIRLGVLRCEALLAPLHRGWSHRAAAQHASGCGVCAGKPPAGS